jgi:hypothetical protein
VIDEHRYHEYNLAILKDCFIQETTCSGQTTKARDRLSAYERVRRINNRYGENMDFVNFVDGWRDGVTLSAW